MGKFKTLLSFFIVSILVTLYMAFAPCPCLLDLDPEPFKTTPPLLERSLAPNSHLDNAERLYEGLLLHPECLDVLNGALYTGLEDGRVVKLQGGNIETIFRSGGPNCDKVTRGCGRPNGLRFDNNGNLIVADPPKGVYKLNVETGEATMLFSTETPIDDRLAKGPNHPDVGKEGDVYFSDVSTKHDMYTNYYEFIEVSANGRVLHYDPRTKTTSTLVDGLYFPNGVQLSPNEDFLIIAQSSKYNILKYHLKGPKKGTLEMFVDNLPGIPDNIRSSGRNTFWVALAGVRFPGEQSVFERLGPYPVVRRLLGRSIYILSSGVAKLAEIIPVQMLEVMRDTIESVKLDLFLGLHHGYVVEIDLEGRIIRSFQSPNGQVYHISHVLEHDGDLYLGTPFHSFVGKFKLPPV